MSRPRPIERRGRAPQRGRSLHPLMERAPPLARVNPTHGQDMSARPPSVHTGRNHLRHRAPGPGTRNRRVPSADHAARKRPPVSDFIFFRFLRVSLQNLSTLPAAPDRLHFEPSPALFARPCRPATAASSERNTDWNLPRYPLFHVTTCTFSPQRSMPTPCQAAANSLSDMSWGAIWPRKQVSRASSNMFGLHVHNHAHK